MVNDKAEEVKRNILSPAAWVRILYMVFYAVACWVLLFVLPVIIICQVIISLITGMDNSNLRDFGRALSDYFHQAMNYLLYASDEKPWPFSDGQDFGESFDDDDDDDSDTDDDDDEIAPRPRAAAGNSNSGDDDVFSDISFTGGENQHGQVPDDDSSSGSSDSPDDTDRKDPA